RWPRDWSSDVCSSDLPPARLNHRRSTDQTEHHLPGRHGREARRGTVGERHGLAPPGARATVNLGGTSAHTAHGERADRGDERNSVTHLLHMAVRSTSPPSQVIIYPPGESP